MPLQTDEQAEVVIIGGGMAGLSCAQRLREQGASVVVLEQGVCGAGATGKSSGFITPDSELGLHDLIARFGEETARKLWEFALSGVAHIGSTAAHYNVACDYAVQDSLYVANTSSKAYRIQEEFEAYEQLNIPAQFYKKDQLASVIGSRALFGALRFGGTFGINAYGYAQGLKEALKQEGVRIYEKTPATRILGHSVEAGRHTVKADYVVACADRFLPRLDIIKKDIYTALTFLGLTKPLMDQDAARIFPKDRFMVWDTDLIYQYYRFTGENRLLIGASSLLYTYFPYERPVPPRIIKKMHAYTARHFPDVRIEIEYAWPGLIGVSKDFLPLAGRRAGSPHVFYIGGAAGLPWAAALGIYIADKIVNKVSDFDDLFTAERTFPIRRGIQTLLRKPLTFALSHGKVKYFK